MKVSYFPGCTLRNVAKNLDLYARECADKLGVVLCELPDWQCCGGVFINAKDEIASKLPSVRALIAAKKENQPLVTVCSACHNVIKQTNYALQTDKAFDSTVNSYLAQEKNPPEPYHGETTVLHYLELLRDVVGFEKVKEAVVNPLKGKKIGCYYGCLLLRPGKILQMDDPENPKIMENLISALGGEPVIFPKRNECCGGYVVLENPSSSERKSKAVLDSARSHGADLIVTACPLCKYNLQKNQGEVPVVYFTELLAEALGVKKSEEQ